MPVTILSEEQFKQLYPTPEEQTDEYKATHYPCGGLRPWNQRRRYYKQTAQRKTDSARAVVHRPSDTANISESVESLSRLVTSIDINAIQASAAIQPRAALSQKVEPNKTPLGNQETGTEIIEITGSGCEFDKKPHCFLPVRHIQGLKNTKAPLVDIGANLIPEYFRKSRIAGILNRAAQAGITHIIVKGTNIRTSNQALRICRQWDGTAGITLRCTMGISPLEATTTMAKRDVDGKSVYGDKYIKYLENDITSPRGRQYCVAIGVCGLDYNNMPDKEPSVLNQKKVFRAQLMLAYNLGLPVFLHSRESHADFLSILKPFIGKVKGVVSCPTDTSFKNLGELLQAGLYIGLTGAITDEKFNTGIVSKIPLERVMLETGAPHFAPKNAPRFSNEWRTYGANEPCMATFIVKEMTRLRKNCTEREVAHITTNVAKKFFRLT